MPNPGDILADEGASASTVMQRQQGRRGARGIRGALDAPFARQAAPPVAMLLLALPSLVLKALTGIDPYDEGIRLYGAMRVLHGAVPYRDFFAMYGPAQFYWPAAWFAVFGEQLWVARMGELVVMGGAAVAMTVLLCQASAGWTARLWTLSSLLLPLSVVYLSTFDPSLSLVLAAGAAVGRRPGICSLSMAGLLLGAASLFRQDFAFYGAVATTAMVIVSAATDPGSTTRSRAALRRTFIVAAGACMIALPAYGWLASPDPYALWDTLVRKPAELIAFRHIPYAHALEQVLASALSKPSPHHVLRFWILLSPIFSLVGLVALAHRGVRAELFADPRRSAILAFLVTLAAGLLVYARARTDVYHVQPLQVVVCAQLAITAAAVVRATVHAPRARALQRLSLVLAAIAVTIGSVDRVVSFALREPTRMERAEHVRLRGGEKWVADAIADISRHAGDAPVYVGAGRHDRVYANFMTAYFLLGRAAPTYYHDIMPGLTTAEPIQRRMIREIDESGVRTAFLWKNAEIGEPNRSATERGSTLLDRYLARHFRVQVDNDRYLVLVRDR
jgi:hypothetical protein